MKPMFYDGTINFSDPWSIDFVPLDSVMENINHRKR